MVAKFEETRSVCNKQPDEPRVLNAAAQIEVICQFAMNPSMSIREAAADTGMSTYSAIKAVKFRHSILKIY